MKKTPPATPPSLGEVAPPHPQAKTLSDQEHYQGRGGMEDSRGRRHLPCGQKCIQPPTDPIHPEKN